MAIEANLKVEIRHDRYKFIRYTINISGHKTGYWTEYTIYFDCVKKRWAPDYCWFEKIEGYANNADIRDFFRKFNLKRVK